MMTPTFASFRVITTAKALLLAACLSLAGAAQSHEVSIIIDTSSPTSVAAASEKVKQLYASKSIDTATAVFWVGLFSGLSSGQGQATFKIQTIGSVQPGTRFALPGQGGSEGTGLAAQSPGDKPWNGWMSWTGTNTSFDFSPLKTSGRVNVYGVGVDYTTQWAGKRTVLGVGLVVDKSKMNTSFNGGTVDGSGAMVTPYMNLNLNPNWSLSAALGVGSGKSKTNALGISGEQKTDRSLAMLGLGYSTLLGTQWMFSGNGGVSSSRNENNAYTLSNGTFLDRGVTTNNQANLGGRMTYNGGTFFPYAGLTYNYDLKAQNGVTANGQTYNPDRDGFQGVLGVQIPTGRGVSAGIQYSTEKGRSQIKNNSFTVNLGLNW